MEEALIKLSSEAQSPPLIFTDSAAKKVKLLLEEEHNSNLKLRLAVRGGGCSGLEYIFSFDEQNYTDDIAVEKNGVVLLIDSVSFPYLKHSEIDYKEDANGEQFVIRNPNAHRSCGCGSSFSTGEKEAGCGKKGDCGTI